MEVVKETWYKATDGLKFDTKLDCLKHELEIEKENFKDAVKKRDCLKNKINSIIQEIDKEIRNERYLKVTEITTEVNFFGR